MGKAKTMILLTYRTENKPKELFTGLKSLIRQRPDLDLKYRTVYGYTHTSGVEYATPHVVIERINIIHPS